ncbi:glycosyltransferase family 2 protein [Azospirillum canadense]|uniref:glycosyltransferase family 2 protein n=1 Tax=Azospirillum canadense TaxID=403962 RepID=UPI002227F8B3|nr:hypothetical protein [Azospirillum canadense]MCW2238516.1 hypothetical protein [Azospirillum canadense]
MKEPITKADITAAILLDDDTLVLFGAIDRTLPAAGVVHLDGSVEGRYGGRSWTDAEGERWFLGGVRVAGLAQLRPSRVEIADEGGERLVLPRLSNVRTNPSHLIAALKAFQPGALSLALDFTLALAASSGTPADGTGDRIGRLLSGLVQEVSQPDGFTEVFGRFRDGSLMLQGWARSFKTGAQKILIEAEEIGIHRATAASFARPDLPSDAAGVLAVLTDPTPAPGTVRRIHYRAADGWRHMEIFEQRTILPEGVAAAHVRDMLGNLHDAEARQAVTRIAASRYDGAETVSQLDVPVRMGMDMVLRVPGAGLFVAGWLLDPTHQVRAVTLKGPGVSARLDGEWSRLSRRDVTEAFQHDGLFAGRLVPGQDQHGFTVFATEPAGVAQTADFHLELELANDRFAFLPLSCLPPAPEALKRMLSLVNLDSPSIETLIARHVGPMLRTARTRGADLKATGIHPMGRPVKAPRVSVVLPVTDRREDVDLNIARLAIDPDFADTELLVVATAGTHERLGGAVRQAAAFYRQSVTFVAAPEATDAFEAIAAALPHARAERVLMLSPSVLPTEKGWLSALERVSRKSGGPVMVSPTLLYEDHSIRFAGIMAVEGSDGAKTFERRYAGYPQDWLKEHEAATVDAAAPECALLPKDALARALSTMGSYMGADHKGLDLCLRLRALGGACVWLPRVTLVALDEQPRDAHADRWHRAGAMVDRWSFEDTWSARVAA